jgi:hypothetical protein
MKTANAYFRITPIVLCLVAHGCGWQKDKAARLRYLQERIEPYEYQQSLDEIWPKALQLLADEGFPLVGSDRELVGQGGAGMVAGFLSAGFETRERGKTGLEAQTDWGSEQTRYRMTGKRTGESSCTVVLSIMHRRPYYQIEDEPVRDFEMELRLMERVDSEAAVEIEEGAIKAKSDAP